MKTAQNGENPTLERNKINATSYYKMAVNAQRPAEAVETYTGPVYRQHNPFVCDDKEGFIKHFVALNNLIPHCEDFRRVIAEDDLVAIHVLHLEFPENYVPSPREEYDFERDALVSMDLFRLDEEGKIIEHWDAMQWSPSVLDQSGTTWDQKHWVQEGWPPFPEKIVGSHTMVGGPTFIMDRDKTQENKSLVKSFVESVLVGGDLDKFPEYFDGGRCIQHNPYMEDGMKEYKAGLKEQSSVRGLTYLKLHRVVAEGNFIFTQCEGNYRGRTTSIMDMFLVENGKIVEHWDVFWEAIPDKLAHENTLF